MILTTSNYDSEQLHLQCNVSTMFLHLSKQCLDEGRLASSNLTHHSHQLTWLHLKVQTA